MSARLPLLLSSLALSAALGCSAWIDTEALGDPPVVGGNTSCAQGCDDGIACTQDECLNGQCVHAVNSMLCGEGQMCDATRGCVSTCVGESCGCQGSACPGGTCSSEKEDRDGDGKFAVVPGQPACGDDCNDADPSVYPGARELCNQADDDCDGVVDDGCVNPPPICQTAIPLTLDASGRAKFNGKLSNLGAKAATSCGTGSGRGAVFSLQVNELADITIDTAGTSFPALIAIGSDCSTDSGFNLGCATGAPAAPTRSKLVIHRYNPNGQRMLYFTVDTLGPLNSGDFQLSVEVIPAPAYTCLGQPLDISDGGKLVGFMGGSGSLNGSCALAPPIFNPSEAIVRYAARVATRLRCKGSSTVFAPVLYAANLCGSPFATEFACQRSAAPGSVEIDLNLAAGAEAYIAIDNGSEGSKYELTCTPQ